MTTPKAMGYASWDTYCTEELDSANVRILRDDRRGVAADLRNGGLSLRAIASATGASEVATEEVDHPAPGARPGEVIAVGPNHRWIAYQTEGMTAAACYIDGRLLRRDLAGWWTAGSRGERRAAADAAVALLVGTVPDGWPVLAVQAPLLGCDLLAVAS